MRRAPAIAIGFFNALITMGVSGQRSRTSKTIGTDSFCDAYMAGNAIVKGVLLAKTTSPDREAALFADFHANLKNDWIRLL